MDNILLGIGPVVIAILALGASIFPVMMVRNVWRVLWDFERRIKQLEKTEADHG